MTLWEAKRSPTHTGKTGRIFPPWQPPAGRGVPTTLPQYADEIASRTYPFISKYLPEQVRIPYELYNDFKYRPDVFEKKLKFWLKYIQANAYIPKKKDVLPKKTKAYWSTSSTQSKYNWFKSRNKYWYSRTYYRTKHKRWCKCYFRKTRQPGQRPYCSCRSFRRKNRY